MLCTWVFLPDSWGTYTKILTKSAVDGDVLLSNEVTEGHVWVVTSERAVRAGGVAVLLIVSMVAAIGVLEMGASIPRD
jgi:hypothetical protein